MQAVAKLNNCPTSPRKMRLVADIVRGKNVDEALNILKYTRKEAAGRVEKLLLSAISNWENKNEGVRVEDAELYVKEIFVDSARVLKRFQPAPMGRAYRIRKRSNHVTLIVDSKVIFDSPELDAEFEEVEGQEEELVEAEAAEETKAKKSKKAKK